MVFCTQDTTFYIMNYVTLWRQVHDDVIKWRHFPRYWPFVRRIHRSPVNSPHKGQWRGALMFTLICARIKGRVNNCKAGDLRRNRAHYDVIVMHYVIDENSDKIWNHTIYPCEYVEKVLIYMDKWLFIHVKKLQTGTFSLAISGSVQYMCFETRIFPSFISEN